MDTEARQILHDERTSDCRSFGSNIRPSSQTGKISIGVMADSKASTRNGAMKGYGAVVPIVGNFSGEKNIVEGVTASFNIKQTEGPEAVKCSWISKSLYQRTPTSEAILQANQASVLVSPGGQDGPDGTVCEAGKHSVQLFSYQTSISPSNNYKKFDGDTSRRKGRKDGTTERVKEFTFTTAQEILKSDKTDPEDKINRTENRTENLRMKLWQILGTTSPKSQHSGSHTSNKDEENLPLEQCLNPKENQSVKTRQNSDTIENDSENTDHTRKRPVTRSWSRKKASSKKQPGKCKSGPSSNFMENHRQKSIFSFEEKWIGKQDNFPNDDSSTSLKRKSKGKKSRIGQHKICFTENDTTDKLHQDTSKTVLPLHDGTMFSLGEKMGGFIGSLPDYQTKCPQTEKNQEKEFYQPPTVNSSDHHGELEVSETGNEQEYRSDPVIENVSKSQDYFQSPTFQLKTPILSSSPNSTPKTDRKANDVSSPTSTERRFSLGTIRSLSSFQTLEPDFNRLGEQRFQEMEELISSIPREDKSSETQNKEQDGSSDSSSEERNFQGSREGTGDSDWIDEASEQNQDGFVRAVELLALELGKVKSKLNSMTSKKSSEILKSVAEEIHLQLQNVHSQIQTDMGRFTNLSKSKRKRLETRFEEQQKQLRLIYNRFKEEINLHLQDCKGTVEDLEADQIEIKGALEKQRVAHKKLLSQVEEAAEIQLNDAERKLRKARGKLLQLKQVVAMCLKEGILN
ncbi:meiosis-specific protein ASY3 [Abrus precatorius]|uniref:Meiosis-specific protein ASY3 n=1 Tax=Abrus precatorius TaxID=3816 RepID=A0A8B8MH13_ABRPR|nr:meiosis-specific protein ASY3 [Abrus precatorius]